MHGAHRGIRQREVGGGSGADQRPRLGKALVPLATRAAELLEGEGGETDGARHSGGVEQDADCFGWSHALDLVHNR
jgi:hypothetical protein